MKTNFVFILWNYQKNCFLFTVAIFCNVAFKLGWKVFVVWISDRHLCFLFLGSKSSRAWRRTQPLTKWSSGHWKSEKMVFQEDNSNSGGKVTSAKWRSTFTWTGTNCNFCYKFVWLSEACRYDPWLCGLNRGRSRGMALVYQICVVFYFNKRQHRFYLF